MWGFFYSIWYNRTMKIALLIFIFSLPIFAKGKIFSLGAGVWNPSISSDTSDGFNGEELIHDFENSKFLRLAHEGLLDKSLLYVVSLGVNLSEAKVQYSFEGDSSTTSLEDLEADISMVEIKLGVKYNLGQSFYFGFGALVGDFQITYQRDDYLDALGGTNAENFVKSENENYLGHYAEVGTMLVSKYFGFRLGVEYNSITLQNDLETLGTKQPILDSSKFYIEIIWKN